MHPDSIEAICLGHAPRRARCTLDLEPDITVIAQAANGREALKLAPCITPDIVITDIEMPDRTAPELADDLKNAASSSRVIISARKLEVMCLLGP
jgi:DNA-binding NarL/FixJ family response regulator